MFKKGRELNEKYFIIAGLIVNFLQNVAGVFKQSYRAQDFKTHFEIISGFPASYDLSRPDPPGLYFLGFLFRKLGSERHFIENEVWLFIFLNLMALACFFGLLKPLLKDQKIRLSAFLLIAFVPFRVEHSFILAADALTLPFFVLILFLVFRLLDPSKNSENSNSVYTWWALSVALSLALLCKYTFIGLLPPILLIASTLKWPQFKKALLSLSLPVFVFLFLIRQSFLSSPWTTSTKEMSWTDLMLLKISDLQLFSAPEYYPGRVYEPHHYSYLGLLHLAVFTDLQNLFHQARIWSQISFALSLPVTVLALMGVLILGYKSLRKFIVRPDKDSISPQMSALTLLALGFCSPVWLGLTQITLAYSYGYWLPRLILPSIITFIFLGFALLEGQWKKSYYHWPVLIYSSTLALVYIAVIH